LAPPAPPRSRWIATKLAGALAAQHLRSDYGGVPKAPAQCTVHVYVHVCVSMPMPTTQFVRFISSSPQGFYLPQAPIPFPNTQTGMETLQAPHRTKIEHGARSRFKNSVEGAGGGARGASTSSTSSTSSIGEQHGQRTHNTASEDKAAWWQRPWWQRAWNGLGRKNRQWPWDVHAPARRFGSDAGAFWP
jgi:hypothetical protein